MGWGKRGGSYILPWWPHRRHRLPVVSDARGGALTRRVPVGPSLVALAALSPLAACDRLPEAVILPEYEFTYSFDGGLSDWTAAATDMGAGTWEVTDSSGVVHLDLANASGTGKVWITHELEVTPEKQYTLDISFDLATPDHDAAQAWKVIAGARSTPPAIATDLPFQDATTGNGPAGEIVWVTRGYSVTAEADEEGLLYLSLGIWGTTTGTRSYRIDNVRVVLTRTE